MLRTVQIEQHRLAVWLAGVVSEPGLPPFVSRVDVLAAGELK